MIFCGMLLPLLALEVSRPEGLMEDSFELQSSAIIAGVFRCGLIRGERMREFHSALSATTNVVPLSLCLSFSLSPSLSLSLSLSLVPTKKSMD